MSGSATLLLQNRYNHQELSVLQASRWGDSMRLMSRTLRHALFALLLLFFAPGHTLWAQETQLDSAAAHIASSLQSRQLGSVVVFDFIGSYTMDPVGAKLASDFNAALTKAISGVRVEDRSRIDAFLQGKQMVSANIRNKDEAAWLASQLGVDGFIFGRMGSGLGGVHVAITAYRVSNGDELAQADAAIPFIASLQALVRTIDRGNSAPVPAGGANGYSSPACRYCPLPIYTGEAHRQGIQGEVLLEFTVQADGYVADDVRVLLGMPYGLTERAVETLRDWRLTPATGPDGKPAAVRQEVELTFHLY